MSDRDELSRTVRGALSALAFNRDSRPVPSEVIADTVLYAGWRRIDPDDGEQITRVAKLLHRLYGEHEFIAEEFRNAGVLLRALRDGGAE